MLNAVKMDGVWGFFSILYILFIIPYENILFCINTYLIRASFMYSMVTIHVENLFILLGLSGRTFHLADVFGKISISFMMQ